MKNSLGNFKTRWGNRFGDKTKFFKGTMFPPESVVIKEECWCIENFGAENRKKINKRKNEEVWVVICARTKLKDEQGMLYFCRNYWNAIWLIRDLTMGDIANIPDFTSNDRVPFNYFTVAEVGEISESDIN